MARTRGCIWLVAGVIVALLAGVVGYVTLSRGAESRQAQGSATVGGPTVRVVTASQIVPVGTLVTAEMVTVKDLPVSAAPEGYLTETEQAVGKISMTDLAVGEILLAGRLLDPNVVAANGRMALVMNEDQVLMAFPANDLMNSLGILKAGDHVDLLFSMPFTDRTGGAEGDTEELVAFKALENLTLAAVVGGQPDQNGNTTQAKALLLTVTEQDALTLKYLKDAGAAMDVVLRAPGAEQPFETEPVDVDRLINEYRIPAAIGR